MVTPFPANHLSPGSQNPWPFQHCQLSMVRCPQCKIIPPSGLGVRVWPRELRQYQYDHHNPPCASDLPVRFRRLQHSRRPTCSSSKALRQLRCVAATVLRTLEGVGRLRCVAATVLRTLEGVAGLPPGAAPNPAPNSPRNPLRNPPANRPCKLKPDLSARWPRATPRGYVVPCVW